MSAAMMQMTGGTDGRAGAGGGRDLACEVYAPGRAAWGVAWWRRRALRRGASFGAARA